jgi:uncharacterized membrane protein
MDLIVSHSWNSEWQQPPITIQGMVTNAEVMGKRDRDDETGEFVDKYPQEAILTAIQECGGLAATSEIADDLDASRNTVYKKLRVMEEDGDVTSRKAGGIRVWTTDGKQE